MCAEFANYNSSRFDIGGHLIGWFRLLIGRASGIPKLNMLARKAENDARRVRYNRSSLNNVIYDYPTRPEPLSVLASVQIEEGDWAGLLNTAQYFMNKFPFYAAGFQFHSRASLELGEVDVAEKLAWDGLRRFKRNSAFFFNIARCSEARGNLQVTLDIWTKAHRIFPNEMWVSLNLARACVAMNHFDRANQLYLRTIELWPEEPTCVAWFAEAAEAAGDWSAAAERWSDLLLKAPARKHAHARLIEALRKSGKHDAADVAHRKAANLFPSDFNWTPPRTLI